MSLTAAAALQRVAFVAAGMSIAISGLRAAEAALATAWAGHRSSRAATAAPDEKLALGVLRRDGVVIPFATFDGKRWRKDWPEPRASVDVPASIRSVPSRWWGPVGPLDTWQAWSSGAPPQTLHVRQPDWYEAQCVQQVGLRTDYRSTQPPVDPKAAPYPKDGLAVSPPQTIEPVEIVPAGLIGPEINAAFDEAEHKAIRRFEDRSKHPAPEKQRALVPLKIEAIYAAGKPAGTRVYYFEASKQYDFSDRMNEDARLGRCGLVSFGGGWFIRAGNGPLKSLGFDVAVVPCNRYQIRYMLPLGVVRLAGRTFWIAQWSGWDYEEYTIVEIKPDKTDVALRVWGGGC
jgi:hypothetical protein